MLFKKKEPIKIGVDLGTSSLKIVKLASDKNGKLLLQNFVIKEISYQSQDISSLLKESLSEVKAEGIPVNISLSGRNAIIRYISMPIMKKEEFKNALRFEAQKYIPFSIDEVEFDGSILKENLPGNKMLILIAAAKKELVNQRIKLLQDLGYSVGAVYIDSLALTNVFNFNYAEDEPLLNKTIALVNIGASITNLCLLEGGIPCLSRDISIAGNNFSERIASDLGMDFKTAEEVKASLEKETLDKIKVSVDVISSQLAQEIRVSFDYYESQSVSSVERIFLSGGGSFLISFQDNLSHLLGIPIQIWDPLSKFALDEGLEAEQIKEKSGQLAVAAGLAMV